MRVVCGVTVGNMKEPDETKRGKVGIVDFPVKELGPEGFTGRCKNQSSLLFYLRFRSSHRRRSLWTSTTFRTWSRDVWRDC